MFVIIGSDINISLALLIEPASSLLRTCNFISRMFLIHESKYDFESRDVLVHFWFTDIVITQL